MQRPVGLAATQNNSSKQNMKPLGVGVRVRYIGGQKTYNNPVIYAIIGRTGIIRSKSQIPFMDWFVEMDLGMFDIDAQSCALVPIDEDQADCFITQPNEEFIAA